MALSADTVPAIPCSSFASRSIVLWPSSLRREERWPGPPSGDRGYIIPIATHGLPYLPRRVLWAPSSTRNGTNAYTFCSTRSSPVREITSFRCRAHWVSTETAAALVRHEFPVITTCLQPISRDVPACLPLPQGKKGRRTANSKT